MNQHAPAKDYALFALAQSRFIVRNSTFKQVNSILPKIDRLCGWSHREKNYYFSYITNCFYYIFFIYWPFSLSPSQV